MPQFDAYLMVDWSGRTAAITGTDSIWYCLLERHDSGAAISELENPATRSRATVRIRKILADLVSRRRRVLVGFDFPYCYPAGFAAALGLKGGPPWLAIWRRIASVIADQNDNRNNRFQVAASLNDHISGKQYPFWGCPERYECDRLSPRMSDTGDLPQRRIAERFANSAQPVWKLFGNGSCGSQALLGIPALLTLRTDPALAPVSRVWPFETGLRRLPDPGESDWLVLHAEVYPSLVPLHPEPGEIKDAAQVRSLAHYFQLQDDLGRLADLFAGTASLTGAERERVEREEGWILGVTERQTASRRQIPQRVDRAEKFVPERKPVSTPDRRIPGRTTDPGYVNRNEQIVLRRTGLLGTDHGQYVYVLQCGRCGHEYGANGSDIFQRRCPRCQGGTLGLAH